MEKQFECVKIKDGLYLGNKMVAFDLQFLIINKFAFIVNCASEVPNLFEEHGLRYVKFKIKHDKNIHIFDQELKRLKKLKKVVEEAEDNGLCCLIHCNQDGYRSLTLAIAYLMDRFKWRLRKTIEYLQSKGVPIVLTDRNIQQLTSLQYTLSRQCKLTHLWIGPYLDSEEELISRTYNNTKQQILRKEGKHMSPAKNVQGEQNEVPVEKLKKRVQWQDRIDKEEKKEKKRILAERDKEQKNERSRQRLEYEANIKRQSKTHAMLVPKQKSEGYKKSKKKIDPELSHEAKKKVQEGEILKLLKKSGKLKKQMYMDDNKLDTKEQDKIVQKEDRSEEKKVYKLTINNYINPNINIIKPPLDKKKKGKTGPKKQKDKFNRTYSEKEAFKKPTFYGKEASRDKEGSREKRNPGHTPVRSRKERKSQKEGL